jgi:hypothetical protein
VDYEDAGTSLLAIASIDLKKGYPIPAYTIFAGLSKQEDGFTLKGDAILGKISTRALIHTDTLQSMQQDLQQQMLGNKTICPDGTVFRAKVLTRTAEVSMGLEQHKEADAYLNEALEIFFRQGEHKKRSGAIHLQAALDVWNGNVEAALKKFNRSTTFGEIETFSVPSFVPTGWVSEHPIYDESVGHASLVSLASSIN